MKKWKWSFQSKDLVFSFPGFTLRTNESGSHHRNNCVRSTAPIMILCQWQSLAFLSAAVQSGSNKCWGQKPENLPRGYIEAIRDTLLPCPESKSCRHNVNLVVYLTIHLSNIPHFWVQSSSCTSIPDLWWFTCPGWHILRFGCSQAVSVLSKMWRVSMASEHTVLFTHVHSWKMEQWWGVGHQHCLLTFISSDPFTGKVEGQFGILCRDKVRWNGHWEGWSALLRPLPSGDKHILCSPSNSCWGHRTCLNMVR